MRKENHVAKLLAASAFILSLGASSLAMAEGAGQYMDDSAITTKVKAALLADSQLKSTQVSVKTMQGVVHLSGTVANKNQESEAVRQAKSIDGVQSVKDLLTVSSSQPE